MSTHSCCQTKTNTRAGDTSRRPVSRVRRGGEIAGWIVPEVASGWKKADDGFYAYWGAMPYASPGE